MSEQGKLVTPRMRNKQVPEKTVSEDPYCSGCEGTMETHSPSCKAGPVEGISAEQLWPIYVANLDNPLDWASKEIIWKFAEAYAAQQNRELRTKLDKVAAELLMHINDEDFTMSLTNLYVYLTEDK